MLFKTSNELYIEYHKLIYNYIKKRVRNTADAEDLTSQVFEKMLEQIKNLKKPDRFLQWLYAIAHHEIIDYYRKCQVLKKQTLSLDTINEARLIPNPRISPLDEQVQNTIKHLTNTEQTIFRLRYLAQMDIKEIMRLTKKSRWAVKKALFRARKKFKKMWREKYGLYI